MNLVPAALLTALAVAAPVGISALAADVHQPMSLSEVIVGAISLVPGSSAEVEAFLHAPGGVKMGPYGWWHPPIDYRTRNGALLHIQLISDWQNTKAPDVVRFMAVVDGTQCLDAAKLRDDLALSQHITWKSLEPLGGWSVKHDGRFLSIETREGNCLAAAIVDDRHPQRPMMPTVRRLVDPSGVVKLPFPDHWGLMHGARHANLVIGSSTPSKFFLVKSSLSFRRTYSRTLL